MTDEFDVSDIAAMRKQGDLHAFMRSLMRPGPPAPKEPEWVPPPGHVPGAWPPGFGPVERDDPLTAWTPEWTAAVEDYRAWLKADLEDDQHDTDPKE